MEAYRVDYKDNLLCELPLQKEWSYKEKSMSQTQDVHCEHTPRIAGLVDGIPEVFIRAYALAGDEVMDHLRPTNLWGIIPLGHLSENEKDFWQEHFAEMEFDPRCQDCVECALGHLQRRVDAIAWRLGQEVSERCHTVYEVVAYVDGVDPEPSHIERHLMTCALCSAIVAHLRGATGRSGQ